MIVVKDLKFSYTREAFIEHVSFQVRPGEILGFLGPSGAGKSTLQKILTGLLPNYLGMAKVCGISCKDAGTRFYEKIGVDFEFPSLYEKLTARQNLKFFASLYQGESYDQEELLDRVGLRNDGDKKTGDFSKGMKARLNFIKALVHNPQILFLDEPLSGLDPVNSRLLKEMMIEEKEKGKTIIFTTHNMADAAELCDRVAFIADGKIKAIDTPHNLIMSKGATKIAYTYFEGAEKSGECLLSSSGEDRKLKMLIENGTLLSIHSSEPTLEDIFIEVTGRGLK